MMFEIRFIVLKAYWKSQFLKVCWVWFDRIREEIRLRDGLTQLPSFPMKKIEAQRDKASCKKSNW